MNVYIIRHGETHLNKAKIHQFRSTPLSAYGRRQIEDRLPLFKSLDIDKIYCSSLLRAKQTAKLIADSLGLKINIIPELEEVRKPTEIKGRKHNDPAVLKIEELLIMNFNDKSWHYSDEENFEDVKIRVNRFLKYLAESEKSNNILIVTHGYVAKMILAIAMFEENLSPQIYLKLVKKIEIKNSSVTKLIFKEADGWKVVI